MESSKGWFQHEFHDVLGFCRTICRTTHNLQDNSQDKIWCFCRKFWMNHCWYSRNCERAGPCYRTPAIPGHYDGTPAINGIDQSLFFAWISRRFRILQDNLQDNSQDKIWCFCSKFWMNHWWYNRNGERTGPCYQTPAIPGHYDDTPTINGIVQRLFCSTGQATGQSPGQSTGQWNSTGQLAGHDLVFFCNSRPNHMIVLLWFLNMGSFKCFLYEFHDNLEFCRTTRKIRFSFFCKLWMKHDFSVFS